MSISGEDGEKILSTVMDLLKDRDYGYVVTDGLAMRLRGLARNSRLEEITFIQPPGPRSITEKERETIFHSLEQQGVFHRESVFFEQRTMAYEPVMARVKGIPVEVPVVAVGDLIWGKVDRVAGGNGKRHDYAQLRDLHTDLGGRSFDTALASHPMRPNLAGLRDKQVFRSISTQLVLTTMTERTARLYAEFDAEQARASETKGNVLTSWLPSAQEREDSELYARLKTRRREARKSLEGLCSAAKSWRGFDKPGRLRPLEHPGDESRLDVAWREMAEQVRINLSVVRRYPATSPATAEAIARAARGSKKRSTAVHFSETPVPPKAASAGTPQIPKIGQSRRAPGR